MGGTQLRMEVVSGVRMVEAEAKLARATSQASWLMPVWKMELGQWSEKSWM
jgi:hypothetical protein